MGGIKKMGERKIVTVAYHLKSKLSLNIEYQMNGTLHLFDG